MANPFIVGPPVRGDDLCGRDVELDRIVAAVAARGLAVVSGAPGSGLTSLALAVTDRVGDPDSPAVCLDLAEAEDAGDAQALLGRALGRLPADRPVPFHLILDGLRREVSLEAGRELLRRTADRRAGTALLGSRVLLREADAGAAGGDGNGDPALSLELSPPPEAAWLPYVLERFLATDRWIGNEHVQQVLGATGGRPRATQAVLRALWDATEREGRVGDGAVQGAVAAAVDRDAAGYRRLMDGLTGNQRRVLRGLARQPDAAPYSGSFVAEHGLASPSSVQRALQSLEGRGLVEADGDDRPRPADPLLERWLRQAGSHAVEVKR